MEAEISINTASDWRMVFEEKYSLTPSSVRNELSSLDAYDISRLIFVP